MEYLFTEAWQTLNAVILGAYVLFVILNMINGSLFLNWNCKIKLLI